MIRQEVILQSPLRFLDRSIRGGLGKGHLGVIMAPAGVGKSACLVQLGLDALLRGRPVLHVALGQSVEHVAAHYDAVFAELVRRVDLADRRGVAEAMAHRRLIWSSADASLGPRGLEEALAGFRAHLALGPSTVLVDGLDWSAAASAATVETVKASAARVGAELWMTARDARTRPLDPGAAPLSALPADCAAFVDVAVLLEPHGRHASLRLVKDLDRFPAADVPLVLEGDTLRLPTDDEGPLPDEDAPGAFTLLATGTAGAEEEFGACAERWGVREVNFTFGGRKSLARTRGLVELTEDELRVGQVSPAYLKAHLRRALPESPQLQRVLQAIWHQVSSAGEVFSVGTLHPDKTASGGTGWAVELGRHWGKPVHLFDQDRKRWFRWDDPDWVEAAPPSIHHVRFAGAGTRSLSPDGRAAIAALFERSFGPPRS